MPDASRQDSAQLFPTIAPARPSSSKREFPLSADRANSNHDFRSASISSARQIAAAMGTLRPEHQRRIAATVEQQQRCFGLINRLRREDLKRDPRLKNPFVWICGGARYPAPVIDQNSKSPKRFQFVKIAELCRQRYLTPDEILRSVHFDLNEAHRAARFRNGANEIENERRKSAGRSVLPTISEDFSREDVAQQIRDFKRGFSTELLGSPDYSWTVSMGLLCALNKLNVITGGGQGAMEAANLGAKEAANLGILLGLGAMEAANLGTFIEGAYSASACLQLRHEEAANPYVCENGSETFSIMNLRKKAMLLTASGMVIAPGGLGSKDEYFQGLYAGVPMALLGTDYWEREIRAISKQLTSYGFNDSPLRNNMLVTDNESEALEFLKKRLIERTGFSDEEVDRRCRLTERDHYFAYKALQPFLDAEAKVVTLVAPDVPNDSRKANDLISSFKDLGLRYRKEGYQLILCGHREIVDELKCADPSAIVVEERGPGPRPKDPTRLAFYDKSQMHDFLRTVSNQYVVFPGVESIYRAYEMMCLRQNFKLYGKDCGLILADGVFWSPIMQESVDQVGARRHYHDPHDVFHAIYFYRILNGWMPIDKGVVTGASPEDLSALHLASRDPQIRAAREIGSGIRY